MYQTLLTVLLLSLTICQGALIYNYSGSDLDFDGTAASKVVNLNFNCVKGNNPRSISFDIRTMQSTVGVIFTTGTATDTNDFAVAIGSSNTPASGIIGILGWNMDYTPSGPTINDGYWHSILITWDGTTLKIYHDNMLTASSTTSTYGQYKTLNFATLGDYNAIGYNRKNNNFYFTGSLKQIKYYDDVQMPLTTNPTTAPSSGPTAAPSSGPTVAPSFRPTVGPSSGPTTIPSSNPTAAPTSGPTTIPSSGPTVAPSSGPTASPTSRPTAIPSSGPTATPSFRPTAAPTSGPTACPSSVPTAAPSFGPTVAPSSVPTVAPTSGPIATPSSVPTVALAVVSE